MIDLLPPWPPGEKEMEMKKFKLGFWVTILATLCLFAGSKAALGAPKLVQGQTIYIPSYANVISGPPMLMVVPLRANLVIHNTDPSHPIMVTRVDHYDTHGKLVEKYLPQPVKLNPLGATRVVVKEPKKGDEGLGANFIVQWHADQKVTEPLIDCLMLGTLGNQGFSFTSQGRIIQEETK
jgi:hypothetical protein